MKSQLWSRLSLVFLALLYSGTSYGLLNPIKLTNFKIGFLRTTPKLFESSTSPEIGWTPIVDFGVVAVRGDISIFSANRRADSKFFISDYEAYLMLPIFPIVTIEAGGGLQNWHGQGGISPVLSGGIMIRIGEYIDRLSLNYSNVFVKDNGTKEFRVGMGFNF